MIRFLFLIITIGTVGWLTAQPVSQTFTASPPTITSDAAVETFTFNIPDDWQADICVEAWGAGGGGGRTGLNGAGNKFPPGGGAGGGAYIQQCFTAILCGDYNIEVGIGGGYNLNGGDSSFDFDGTKYDAEGGRRGGSATATGGGEGGVASAGTIAVNGGKGGTRAGGGENHAGGGGGGSGPAAAPGNAAVDCVAGTAGTGAGAGGDGGDCNGADATNYGAASAGTNGVFPGGGGGGRGGALATAMPEQFPGLGANGQVIVTVSNAVSVACTPLPVELVSFTAKLQDEQVVLDWKTASELDNNYFSIEQSTDGRLFKELERVKGAGTTNISQTYQFFDSNPDDGVNYYRLRQVDFNGDESFSSIVQVTSSKNLKIGELSIIPTIVQNDAFLKIDFSGINESESILEIINISGQVVATYQVNLGNGQQEIPVADLANGVYLVRTMTSGQLMTGRFMKVN